LRLFFADVFVVWGMNTSARSASALRVRLRRPVAIVTAAVLAVVLGPASVFAATGGSGGTYQGGGASNPEHDVILVVQDAIRSAVPGDPAAKVRGSVYAEQGWGQDSTTYMLEQLVNPALGQIPSPFTGSGWLGGSGDTEDDFYTICDDALADATARSSTGTRASRVVGVYFTYANWSINWSAHGSSASEWANGFDGPWEFEKRNTWYNGDHAQYEQTLQDGVPALVAIYQQFQDQIAAINNGQPARRMVCVALNEEEPRQAKISPIINTDVPTTAETLSPGETANDAVSFVLPAGETWPTGLTSVRVDGTLYGPFLTKPSQSPNPPAGAPVAGTRSVTFTAPGTKQVTGPPIQAAGYYVWVWSVDHTQNSQYIKASNKDNFAEGQEILRAVFAPEVSTAVDNEFVEKGDPVSDKLTFSGEGWPTYAGNQAAVKAVGTLYGPYDRPQATSNTVPAGAPVAGTAEATRTSPGDITAAKNVTATQSGYYTWVWEVKQASQTAAIDGLIDADFTDGFFQANETSTVKAEPKLDSKVETTVLDQGVALRDTVIVSGVTAGDLWLRDTDGQELTIPLKYEVFGPYAAPRASGSVETEATKVLSGVKDVVNYGSYTYELGALNTQGYYTVVWSIDTARLSEATKAYLDETDETTADPRGVALTPGANGVPDSHEVTDGTWAANETAVVPLSMDLSTTVNIPASVRGPGTVTNQQTDPAKSNGALEEIANTLVINKDGSVADRVTIAPAKTGGEWIDVPGLDTTDPASLHPLRVPMRVDLYGPFASNDIDYGSATPVATAKFTADHYGDYEVTFDGKVPENSGFYNAVARVDTNALDDETKTYLADGLLGETATDGAWAVQEGVTAALQFDLSSATSTRTISKNEKFSDVVTVAKVDPDDKWIAPNGSPLKVPMKTEVFGPFDDLGDLVHPDGKPIKDKLVATALWVATGYGDYKLGDLDGVVGVFDNSRLAYSGYYTIVTSVDAARLADSPSNPMADSYAQTRIFLDDRWETGDPNDDVPDVKAPGAAGNRATDGYWSDGEQITVRMAPVVETLRQNRLLDEKDLPQGLVDNIRLTLLDETYANGGPEFTIAELERQDVNANELEPGEVVSAGDNHTLTYQGDLWINVAGQPVEIAVLGDAYGPYNRPQPQTADPTDSDKAKQIGTRHVVFTRSQILTTPIVQTPGEPAKDRPAWNKVPAGGQSYAKAKVDPNGLWITPQDKNPVACTGVFVNPDLCEAFNPKEGAPADTVTGFYTWESKILADQQTNTARPQDVTAEKPGTLNAYFESWDSDFWIANETTSVRDQIIHVSRTLEPSVDPGGRFFDDVRVGQFRDDHGDFLGLDAAGWGADETTATLTVYGPLFAEPDNDATAVPPGTPVYTQATLKAENGYWIVGAEDFELLEAPMEAPINPETGIAAERTWFVFVYEFAGDDRTTEYKSDFGDSLERAYVDYRKPDKRLVPGIDIEKASGAYPAPGFGNGTDGTDNVATDLVFDADISETAVELAAKTDELVYFTITNTGTDTLTDLVIWDKTLKGDVIDLDLGSFRWNGAVIDVKLGEDGKIRSGEGFYFKKGDSITFTGTLPGMAAGTLHGDTVTVTGVGVESKDTVHDSDEWWARTPAKFNPRIDIEKSDTVDVRAGSGNFEDADDNGGAADDHDTEATLRQVTVGESTTVYFRVTNVGDVNLVDAQVTDTTIIGGKTVDIKWDDIPPVLAPGAFFTGRGVLEGLAAGELHGDEVEVKARPQIAPAKCAEVAPEDLLTEGCVVGDKDQWHALGEAVPAIDVEKASGTGPPAGQGNMADKPDNVASDEVFDADTVDTAVKLDAKDETVVHATVTNLGNEGLGSLVITDVTAVGEAMVIDPDSFTTDQGQKSDVTVTLSEDGKTATVTFDEGFIFEAGASIFFTGKLPALGDEAHHTDKIAVAGTGVASGKQVGDEDPWIASTDPASIPSVDVEKASGGQPGAGVGDMGDKPDNVATEKIFDADTANSAVVVADDETKVYVTVTNKGGDDLTGVQISDVTLTGKPVAIDVASIKLKDTKHANDDINALDDVKVSVKDGVITFNEGFQFEAGAVISFTATLPGLGKGETHADNIAVTGVGVKSGVKVSDEDPWHATTKPPEPDKPAVSVEKFDLRTIALAGNEVKDAAFAEFYKPDGPADRDSDDKALVFYSVKDAERDRIGVIVTNTGTEDLVDLKLTDVTPEGFGGQVVDWRVLLVAGEAPAEGVTWDDLSGVTLKPGETIVLDGALTGMDETKVHKDTVTVIAKGKNSGKDVTDTDDWFAKIATTPGDTEFKEDVPGVIKILPEKTGVKYVALVMVGVGAAVVAAALRLERQARRRQQEVIFV
jgi:hypothetical protein